MIVSTTQNVVIPNNIKVNYRFPPPPALTSFYLNESKIRENLLSTIEFAIDSLTYKRDGERKNVVLRGNSQ